MKTVLFKLGGSLLDWVEFPNRLSTLIETLDRCRRAIVVGGGGGADWIRKLDYVHKLDAEVAHDLAVEMMNINSYIAARLIATARLTSTIEEVNRSWENDEIAVIAPKSMLSSADAAGSGVPKDWATTSDTIAAWFAKQLEADELVLVKSKDFVDVGALDEAAAAGLVDPAFPEAARRLDLVSICNLRANPLSKRRLWSRLAAPGAGV